MPSRDQLADGMTKSLPRLCFLFLKDKTNVSECPIVLRGNISESSILHESGLTGTQYSLQHLVDKVYSNSSIYSLDVP